MRDRARAGGDAGISAARPPRTMHRRAASRAEHLSGAASVAGGHHPAPRYAAIDAQARIAHLGQDAQQQLGWLGRDRVYGVDDAVLRAADDLEPRGMRTAS